jgi:solute carrier family 25 citrate transporter 1
LIAGGGAGFVESSICHPLDTIKTRMQLRKNAIDTQHIRHSLMEPGRQIRHSLMEPAALLRQSMSGSGGGVTPNAAVLVNASVHEPAQVGQSVGKATNFAKVIEKPIHNGTVKASLGPLGSAKRIIQREGFFALYKGLTAVYAGIVPKMAIRFVTFEQYKEYLAEYTSLGRSNQATFLAGLGSGLTEAILVVTPAEVCKIRMQSQYHSLVDPAQREHRKYRNVIQTAFTITREEGIKALYKGLVPTMLRQGCNQAVNFTAYSYIKKKTMEVQGTTELASWQSLLIGGVSGGMGPMVNNPLDVVKTRLQKQVIQEGSKPKYTGLMQACLLIGKEEGAFALWKGITPRLLRIMPGQAITFTTYEAISSMMTKHGAL